MVQLMRQDVSSFILLLMDEFKDTLAVIVNWLKATTQVMSSKSKAKMLQTTMVP